MGASVIGIKILGTEWVWVPLLPHHMLQISPLTACVLAFPFLFSFPSFILLGPQPLSVGVTGVHYLARLQFLTVLLLTCFEGIAGKIPFNMEPSGTVCSERPPAQNLKET